jgi:hypothetical protein
LSSTNNTVERSIRPITLNRKNTLFAGSDGGANHWATIATRIETCKLNDIDPLRNLTDVLASIVNAIHNRDIEALLPWAYRKQELRAAAEHRLRSNEDSNPNNGAVRSLQKSTFRSRPEWRCPPIPFRRSKRVYCGWGRRASVRRLVISIALL